MRFAALILVIVIALGFGAWKQQDEPVTYSCGQVASGGHQLNDRVVTIMEDAGRFVRWVQTHKDDPINEASIRKTINAVWHEVLWLWVKALIGTGNGLKIDPQILRLHEQAEQERQAAEQQCTPCPIPNPDQTDPSEDPLLSITASSAPSDTAGVWDDETRKIATAWVKLGQQMGIPRRGWVVIVAAGMQESGGGKAQIHALDYGDSSSVGPLQLIDTHGTKAQRMDPIFSGRWFYSGLKQVKGWQGMALTVAAQSVQRSRFPDRYAKWEQPADRLVSDVTNGVSDTTVGSSCSFAEPGDNPGETDPSATTRTFTDPWSKIDYTIPMPADAKRRKAINFALDQLGDPYVWAAHGPDSWDCSGLVSGAWAAAGETVYPQTEVMVRQEVHVTTPQPGDLLYHPGHVQMFLGVIDGKTLIVEAPRTGRPVMVRPQWMDVTAILDPTAPQSA